MTWDETLLAIERRLSPADLETFKRRHRNFVDYPMDHTCRAFYDFAAKHALLDLLASYRFERLRRIGSHLSTLALRDRHVLELGAGGGYLAAFLRDECGARVSVMDLSPETVKILSAAGFEILSTSDNLEPKSDRLDFIVCADSLGEINSDEDSWLREPENGGDPDYAMELDQRYGLAAKLAPWKSLLKTEGQVLLFEPIGLESFWVGAAASLQLSGWNSTLLGPEPAWGLALSPNP